MSETRNGRRQMSEPESSLRARVLAASAGALLIVATSLFAGCVSYPSTASVSVQRQMPQERTLEEKMEPKGPLGQARNGGVRRERAMREIDLQYRAELGVFEVVDWPDHYHDGDRYLRWNAGRWESNAELSGRWRPVSASELPSGLRNQYMAGSAEPNPTPPASSDD